MNWTAFLAWLVNFFNWASLIRSITSSLSQFFTNSVIRVNIWHCAVIATIVCFFYNVITYPEGALNTFMKWVFSFIFIALPSTPDQYKFWHMIDVFSASYPAIGWGPVLQILTGISGMLTIYLTVKVLRFLPFFG